METTPTNIIIAFLKSFLLMFDVQMVSFAEYKKEKKTVWDGWTYLVFAATFSYHWWKFLTASMS